MVSLLLVQRLLVHQIDPLDKAKGAQDAVLWSIQSSPAADHDSASEDSYDASDDDQPKSRVHVRWSLGGHLVLIDTHVPNSPPLGRKHKVALTQASKCAEDHSNVSLPLDVDG